MRRQITSILLALVTLASAALSLSVPSASASRNEITFFEAPHDLLDPRYRAKSEAQLQSLGVHALRVVLYWEDVAPAPGSAHRPHFDATDPTQYRWGQYDAEIADAERMNWTILLTVSGPVPRWATATRRDNVTRPDPLEFQRFMTAVARHYGTGPAYYSIWNEPNHPQFLDPQYVGGQPASPRIYRALWQAGYQGLLGGGLKSPKVLMGETAPTGTGHDVAPLAFLRGALCLTGAYHRASSCSGLPAYGYAHHAYTKPVGPGYVPPNRDDVTIGVLGRLVQALDRAARAGAVRHGMPIFLTEYGVQSKPNPFLGVPLPQQAEFTAQSERIAVDNPRVAAFSQYLLRDDPAISRPGSGASGLGDIGFQTGLELANGRTKPAYAAFRLPLAVARRGHRFSLWGRVRPATSATTVVVQVLRGRRWSNLRTVRTDSLGEWSLGSGVAARAWRVHWTSPAGSAFSGPAIRAY